MKKKLDPIDQGEPIIFEAWFYDVDPDDGGVLTDPALPVTLEVKRPDGIRDTGLSPTHLDTGYFKYEYATKDEDGLFPAGRYHGIFITADDGREPAEALVIADKSQ